MKTLRCSDLGFNCDAVVKAENDQQVLAQAADHASKVHHVEITPEMAEKIQPLIKEES